MQKFVSCRQLSLFLSRLRHLILELKEKIKNKTSFMYTIINKIEEIFMKTSRFSPALCDWNISIQMLIETSPFSSFTVWWHWMFCAQLWLVIELIFESFSIVKWPSVLNFVQSTLWTKNVVFPFVSVHGLLN